VPGRLVAVVLAGAVTIAVGAGCSSDTNDSGSGTPATTAAKPKTLDILVSNDDGYAAAGIDVVVQALRKLPNVKLQVFAPAENQSGTGSRTTPGAVTATDQQTTSGFPVTAVNGFPADAVNYGLAHTAGRPDLVVTGINQGQNLGPITAISGTVGAAEAGLAAGIPALAASQGTGDPPDYPTAAALVVDWVSARRDALASGTATKNVVSLNVPTCTTGTVRGLRQEPLSGPDLGSLAITGVPDCTSTATDFTGDVPAFLAGFATATELDTQKQTITSSTTWPPAR
jgi:5'/3'-nucleotidase